MQLPARVVLLCHLDLGQRLELWPPPWAREGLGREGLLARRAVCVSYESRVQGGGTALRPSSSSAGKSGPPEQQQCW